MAASPPAKPARLNAKAQRCEPYTDGHWLFVYDGDQEGTLRDLEAHDVLLGFASGKEADRGRLRA